MKSRLAMYRNSVSQPGVAGTKQGQNPKVGASMKVPPNTHEYCSRTNPQKISCQNDARLYDKGTKSRGGHCSGLKRGKFRLGRMTKQQLIEAVAGRTDAKKSE